MANKFRESRFRVWDYGNNMYRAANLFALTGHGYLIWWPSCGPENVHAPMDRFEYEFWTGLTDTKGRAVYVGDIIELADGNRGVTKFDNGRFYHTAESPINGLLYWNEVVGNIHQNPELLNASVS